MRYKLILFKKKMFDEMEGMFNELNLPPYIKPKFNPPYDVYELCCVLENKKGEK